MKTIYVALFIFTILTSYLHGVVNEYGLWLDDDGSIIPGPKIRDFIDIDNDGIDDRYQAGPGQPRGVEKTIAPLPPQVLPEPPIIVPPTPQDIAPPQLKKPTVERKTREEISPSVPTDIKAMVQSQSMIKQHIKRSLQDKIKQLGEHPSREDVQQVVEQFKKDNQQLIDQQKEIGSRVRGWYTENMPRRVDKPDTNHAKLRDIQLKLRELREDLDEVSKGKTPEEKKALMEQYKADAKSLHESIKSAAKLNRLSRE